MRARREPQVQARDDTTQSFKFDELLSYKRD